MIKKKKLLFRVTNLLIWNFSLIFPANPTKVIYEKYNFVLYHDKVKNCIICHSKTCNRISFHDDHTQINIGLIKLLFNQLPVIY